MASCERNFQVVVHYFAHQLLDHALADRRVLAGRAFRYHFGDGGNNLGGIDDIGRTRTDGIFRKKIIDHFDDAAVQAWPFIVGLMVFRHRRYPFDRRCAHPLGRGALTRTAASIPD